MENNINETEKTEEKKKIKANLNTKGILIASILFASGWSLGNIQGPILEPYNTLTIAVVILALGIAMLIHDTKRSWTNSCKLTDIIKKSPLLRFIKIHVIMDKLSVNDSLCLSEVLLAWIFVAYKTERHSKI